MNKSFIFISILLLVSLLFMFSGTFIEYKLKSDCLTEAPRNDCNDRARAMAHLLSAGEKWKDAEEWYRYAAERGDTASMFHLAWIYAQQAPNNFGKQIQEALHWYRKSAQGGFAPAMNNLAEIYWYRTGNEQEAIKWYEASAKLNNPIAMINMSIIKNEHANNLQQRRWKVSPNNDIDISSPTLDRTTMLGSTIPADMLSEITYAIHNGEDLSTKFSPIKADPSIPTFKQRMQELGIEPATSH